MRAFVMSGIIYLNFIIESSLLVYMQIRSIKPNTTVALTVCCAILRGSVEGALIGLFAGLFQDIFFGDSIGYYALIYMTIGYLCGLPTDNFFKDNFYIPLIFSVISVIITGFYIFVTGFLIRGKFDLVYYFTNIILPETVYTAVFTFFIYRMMFGVNKKLEDYEYEKRKVF